MASRWQHREWDPEPMPAAPPNDTHTQQIQLVSNPELQRQPQKKVRDTQLILVICGFCICEFTHSLPFLSNPQVGARGSCGHSRTRAEQQKHVSCPTPSFPLRWNKATCLSVSQFLQQASVLRSINVTCRLVMLLFDVACGCRADMLSSVPVMCPTEKRCQRSSIQV